MPRKPLVLALLLMHSVAHAMLVYAHRGARSLWPENTLYAYLQALKLQVDFIDMDVHLTRDGVVVVTHDDFLNPDITQDAQGHWITQRLLIKRLTYAELQQYNVCHIKPGTVYARLFPLQQGPRVCHIPRLIDVIRSVQQQATYPVRYQIELKTNPRLPHATARPRQLARAVVEIIRNTGITGQTEVQAFDFRCLNAVQRLAPEVATAYLTDHTSRAQMLSSDRRVATHWTGGPRLATYQGSLPRMVKALGGRLWEPEFGSFTKAEVSEAHALGLKVVVWNWPEYSKQHYRPAHLGQLAAWGVDGVIADHPEQVAHWLKTQQR